MPDYQFVHPIEVRYGDLDPQGHVNNAKFMTYFEQARVSYLVHLGLFSKDQSFLEIGIILAEAQLTFLAPVLFDAEVRVGVRVTRLGNKSLTMEYRMFEARNNAELATGSSVLVTYAYRTRQTIPIPDAWREKIAAFEKIG
jgi:acyl-CoA thioester hydrolase